jgi:hypothetical protein
LATVKSSAEVEPDLPRGWLNGENKLQRLFPDFAKKEREYYKKSRIFRIMHPIVMNVDPSVRKRVAWDNAAALFSGEDCAESGR